MTVQEMTVTGAECIGMRAHRCTKCTCAVARRVARETRATGTVRSGPRGRTKILRTNRSELGSPDEEFISVWAGIIHGSREQRYQVIID